MSCAALSGSCLPGVSTPRGINLSRTFRLFSARRHPAEQRRLERDPRAADRRVGDMAQSDHEGNGLRVGQAGEGSKARGERLQPPDVRLGDERRIVLGIDGEYAQWGDRL